MVLAGKVAKLSAQAKHMGSAWLIDAEHALTALHCVRATDGTARTNLTLSFYGGPQQVEVDALQINNA